MVGFLRSPAIEGPSEEDLKFQTFSDSKDPLDHLALPEIEDSFFDFDSAADWCFQGNIDHPKMAADLGDNPVDFSSIDGEFTDIFEVVDKHEVVVDELSGKEEGETEGIKLGDLIEKEMEKVRLDGDDDNLQASVVSEIKNDEIDDESGSDEDEDESSSSASSSSAGSSSSSDEEEEEEEDEDNIGEKKSKGVVVVEKEEGEILLSDDADEMANWSDNDEEDFVGTATVGPIMSKNELKVLPPVPSVSVSLEPHHQVQPVGIILSVIGAQVIVEGVEKHNPLNEGSILWITESRSPLGIVDEIFGPVKNPYYIVRYNEESEVPNGIQQGTCISFVPEFAKHVLNEKSLYQKGYDASGENDEELSDDLEFSDDEKEAEYRRMIKIKKRGGANESNNKPATKRNGKKTNGNLNRNNNRDPPPPQTHSPMNQENNIRQDLSTVPQSAAAVPTVAPQFPQFPHHSGAAVAPTFPQFPQGPGFVAPNGMWNNGFPHQQQNMGIPNGLAAAANGMMWMQQNVPYQLYQTPMQTNMAFQQQMSTIPGFPLNFNANFVGNAATPGQWPMLNQQQFGMAAFQAQQNNASSVMPFNGGGEQQPVQSQGSQINPNFQQQQQQQSPSTLPFNQGRGGGGGGGGGGGRGRGQHRGGGRFGGGRGRYQSR
ncbi:hypothetical protein ACP275_08G113400 [Erythranthe tilingii]